jgi:hypothetical protein
MTIETQLAELLDAYGKGHWTRFDGVLNDLKAEAAPHLLSVLGDGDKGTGGEPAPLIYGATEEAEHKAATATQYADNFDDAPAPKADASPPAAVYPPPTGATLQCMQGAHNWSEPREFGWHHCLACGQVNITPASSAGAVDVGAANR